MDFPLFHDPLQGSVSVDASVREPKPHRQPRSSNRPARQGTGPITPGRAVRQREVAKVAEDLRALMERSGARG